MATGVLSSNLSVPWWKEPTKDQWLAWIAAWLGWILDAFDFTIFLLVIVPIANEFGVSVTAVTAVLTFTLWFRLLGAVGAGWLGDRIGRRAPLMLAIMWFSFCNFIAGFSPSLTFLLIVRAALGIGMGAEWPAGASLAMESWPARSRGLMGGLLQGSWGLGFGLSSVAYWLLFDWVEWRGLFWIAAVPGPLLCAYIRYFVKEPEVWVQNRRQQREQKREVHSPLFVIFNRAMLGNTLTACWYMAGAAAAYYAVNALFATWLQQEFQAPTALIAIAVLLSNLAYFSGGAFWGSLADRIGRRGTIVIQAFFACAIAPIYLLTTDLNWILVGFVLQGTCGSALASLSPAYMSERFPTEVRSTASGFCYHAAFIVAGLVPLVISYFAVEHQMGFAVPMLIATIVGALNVIIAVLMGPETKGKVLVPELMKS